MVDISGGSYPADGETLPFDFETPGTDSMMVESGQTQDDPPEEEEIPATQPDPVATEPTPSAEMPPPSEVPKRVHKKPAASGKSLDMLDDEAMGDRGCGEFQFSDQPA